MTRNQILTPACRIFLFLSVFLWPVPAVPQAPEVEPQYQPEFFSFQEVMVPMRDGVRLQTVVITPKQVTGPLPIILFRTPYGVPENEKAIGSVYDQPLLADGYIFVFQNIRGRFKSEGTFVMQRPPRDKSNPKSIDEGTDAYDTIDWLIKNVPSNNGRVGMTGGPMTDGW
jgi:hypothetical protein